MEDGGGRTYTVDDALCVVGFGKFQFMAFAYAGTAWAAEAMETMLLSFIGPSVRTKWSLSSHQQSLLSSVVFAGELIGNYTWGAVSDNYGRRKGFLFTALVTSVAGMASSFSPNYITLLVLRFVVGIGLAGGPVLTSWFLEFVPPPNRGSWMMIFAGCWTFGTIAQASLAWVVMPRLGWRWLLALSSIPSFFLLVFYAFIPESPRYLCLKGKTDNALVILNKLARMNNSALPSGTLVCNSVSEIDTSYIESNNTPPQQTPIKTGPIAVLLMLFSRKLVVTTLLIWVVFLGNAFLYYGVVLLTSKMNDTNPNCATDSTSVSSHTNENLYKTVLITSCAEIPGVVLPALFVDRIGRKISMAFLLIANGVFLMPLVSHFRKVVTTMLLFGARICVTGSYNIIHIYAPEIYPTSVRTTGLGIASSMGKLGGILCPLVAVALVDSCKQTIVVVLFGAVSAIAAIACLILPVETKARQLNDVIRRE